MLYTNFKKTVLAYAFVCLALPNISRAYLVDKVVGIVNSDVVLLSDILNFEKTISLRRELDPIFGFSQTMAKGSLTKDEILDFLIQEHLVSQAFSITDNEVEQEIQSVQRNNRLSREDLIAFLRSKGFSFDEYFKIMKAGLEKRNLLDREIRSRVNITDEDVKNYYYNTVAKNTEAPADYNLSIIMLNYRTYKTPQIAEKIAQELLQSILRGESFSDAASRSSDDSSSENGGELGFLSADQLSPALRSQAKKLKVGEISPLVKMDSGIAIIKLNDVRTSESSKFKEVKEQIRETMARDEYKKQLYLWAERAKNNAYVHTNSFQ